VSMTTGASPAGAVAIRTLAANQNTVSNSNGAPAKPRWPVQLGTAVRRKPAMAAATKPNIISCACHRVGGHPLGRGTPNPQIRTHSGMRSSAATPAARNVGRNPLARMLDCEDRGEIVWWRERGMASF